MDWIIGQDKALTECKLCLDEWVRKLTFLKEKKWWKDFENPTGLKPQPKEWLPAGPFLMLLGDAGTGKSLLGRAMSTYMTEVYKKHDITLYDVIGWKNRGNPSEPKISIHPTGEESQKVLYKATHKEEKKSFWKKWGFRLLQGFMLGMGGLLIGISFYWLFVPWIQNSETSFGYHVQEQFNGGFFSYIMSTLPSLAPLLGIGVTMMFSAIFISWIGKLMGGGGNTQGIGGSSSSSAPKLYVNNSSGRVPFIDATGHGSAQLFGSIAWDPFQTGGLGTPEHQRVTVGDVHRAHLGVLFIDEIKNLTGAEAITLLTVLEDGQLPVALRSQFHGGDTAAMAVATEPIPCMIFLIAAGNMDSVPQIHPALFDRIQGYGKVVYMNNDMPNTIDNRRKFVQFIAQEIKRFNLLPFSRDACKLIVDEARRKSGRKNRLTCKFRPMISIVKTASILAVNEGKPVVEPKHIQEAMEQHCKNIHQQMLDRMIETQKDYFIINPNEKPKIGQIYGLAVSQTEGSDDMAGSVLPVRASLVDYKKESPTTEGYFHVTGVDVKDESYVQHSISKVAHVIQQKFGFCPEDKRCHIDFAQEHGVEGPSAGITMTLALISCITKKKIRQDIAVTGEINIGVDDEIIITPIGGTHYKIMAAQQWGFKKVLIPQKNFENDIVPSDYKIKVVGCRTLEDYMREILC